MIKEYVLDAENKALGRLASETASILRGKKEVDFAPNRVAAVKVKVVNLDKIKISEKKIEQKYYKRHSGYPGGLKITPMKKALEKKGIGYVFKKAVMGMLSKNKLRNKMIKNLILVTRNE
jgi:large subunit ribosomal protein L13